MSQRKKRFLAEFSFVAGGKILALASLFLLGIVIARIIGPEEYGRYAAALSLILLLDATLGAPLDWAVVRFGTLHDREPARVSTILAASFRLKGIMAAFLILIISPFLGSLAGLLFPQAVSAERLLLSLLLATVALLFLRSLASYLQLQRRFRAYALLDLATAITRILLVLPLFLLEIDEAAVYIGLYGLAAALVFVVALMLIRPGFLLAPWPVSRDLHALLGFCGSTSLIMILGTLTGRADILVLGAVNGGAETGFYAAAAHLSMLATMVAGYIAVVMQPRIIPAVREGGMRHLCVINCWGFLGLMLIALPVILWALPGLVGLLYGDSYLASVVVLQVLLLGTCLDLLIMPVLQPFVIQCCPRWALLAESVIALLFIMLAFLVAVEGMRAMAWLMTVVRLVKLIAYGLIARAQYARVKERMIRERLHG